VIERPSDADGAIQVRKIRCDGKPGGCSPCAQNNVPCKTTDRITGKATTRGHTENLEAQNDHLKAIIADLQARLKEFGVDYKPPLPNHDQWSNASTNGEQQQWKSDRSKGDITPTSPFMRPSRGGITNLDSEPSTLRALPPFKIGCTGDNYLGVSSADSLSPIKGLSLSIFGVDFDLSRFVNEASYLSQPLSYQKFLDITFNRTKEVEPVPLPSFEEVNQFATWYWRSIHCYCPVLDRKAFTDLVSCNCEYAFFRLMLTPLVDLEDVQ
jgi:hypothetical protein